LRPKLVLSRLPEKLFLTTLVLAGITGIVNLFTHSAMATEAILIVGMLGALLFCILSKPGLAVNVPPLLAFLCLLLCAFFAIGSIHAIIAGNPTRYLGIYSYLVSFLAALTAYQLVRGREAFFNVCLRLLAVLVVLNCAASILEHIVGPSFFFDPGLQWPRTPALFRTTLGFSGFLGCSVFAAFVVIHISIRNWILRNGLYLIIIIGGFFTMSRMLVIIFAAVILVVWPMFWLLARRRILIGHYIKVGIALAIITLVLGIRLAEFRQIKTVFDFQELSNRGRVTSISQGLTRLWDDPAMLVFGAGFGVAGSGMEYFGGTEMGVEGYVFKTLLEMGIPLAVLFWSSCAFVLIKLAALFRREAIRGDTQALLACAVTVSLLIGMVQNLVQCSSETPSTAIWYWSLFGAVMAMGREVPIGNRPLFNRG